MAGFSFSVLRISAFRFPNFSFSTLSFSSIRRDLRPEGRAEPRSEAPRPMRRSFRTRSCFFGWIPRVGTLGWYAMPLQGMGSGTRSAVRYRRHNRGAVSGTRSAAGIGDTIEAPYRERRRRPVSETRSRHRIGNAVGGRYRKRRRPICPEWGNAYQPRASPWELHPRESVCSEGTPHRESRGRRDENRKRNWLVSHCQFSEFQLS